MGRKRHAPPATAETVLANVIRGLEWEQGRPRALDEYRRAIITLLMGPLFAWEAFGREVSSDKPMAPENVLRVRADLLAFLREIVRRPEADAALDLAKVSAFGPEVRLHHGITFRAALLTDGRVGCVADGATPDIVALNLVFLLYTVGLHNVRICGDCPRLFVKTYRREFCSIQCQKRRYERDKRKENRERREKQQRTRRNRRAAVPKLSLSGTKQT